MLINGEHVCKAVTDPEHAAQQIAQPLLGALQAEAFIPPHRLGVEQERGAGIGQQDQPQQRAAQQGGLPGRDTAGVLIATSSRT